MGPVMQYVTESPVDPITLLIYPKGGSEFELCEDDGETYGYEEGAYCTTRYVCDEQADGSVLVTLGRPQGDFPGRVRERGHILQVHSPAAPCRITVDDEDLPASETEDDCWSYKQDGFVSVRLSGVRDRTRVHITYV